MLEQRKLTLALIHSLKNEDDWTMECEGRTAAHVSGQCLSVKYGDFGAGEQLRFWQRRRVAKALRKMLCRKSLKQLEGVSVNKKTVETQQ